MEVKFKCNGQERQVRVSPETSLLDVLRDQLGLQGTKKGCDEGDCGACSVMMNGKLVNSCLVMAGKLNGANVLTIEGLAQSEMLHPLQQAFIKSGAIQCGYCTPGMIMAAYALLQQNTQPSNLEIRKGLSGNLCRCTGYSKITKAVELAVAYLNEGNFKHASEKRLEGGVR